MSADGFAAGARFPEELIPHAAARKLLERLGVEIVAGDRALIAQADAAITRRRLREQRERSVRAAEERNAHLPYRRR